MKKAALISFLASGIVINELMPHPSPGSDWVELFNPTSQIIDLSNWKLFDSTSSMKTLSGSINPNSFSYFDVYNRLTNAGDTITLKDPSGQDIDSYNYTADPGINISLGRSPDGENWQVLNVSSKGSPNSPPSPTPTPSPNPSPSPSSSPTSSFTVSTPPSSINLTDSFSVLVNISGLQALSGYYLKGSFVKDSSTNYFGKTQVGGDWIKNSQSYSSQLPITTNSSGSWSGNITVLPDAEDSGFSGTGAYLFKVARYLSSGSGLTWSSESSVTINEQNQGTSQTEESLAEIESPAPSVITTTSPVVEAVSTQTIEQNLKTINIKTRLPDLSSNSAKIAGVATESATPSALAKIKSRGYVNLPLVAGGVLIGISFGSMLILKKIGKI